MKTAISVPEDIFIAVDEASKTLDISRSKLFSIAAEKYIKELQAEQTLQALNEVYIYEDPKENKFLKQTRVHFGKTVLKGEKY